MHYINVDAAVLNVMEPMLTIKELSRMLYVHPNTVRRWSDQGIIKAVRINSRGDRRFRRSDIASFLVELEGNGGNPYKASMV